VRTKTLTAVERSIGGTILTQVAAKHGLKTGVILGPARRVDIVAARWETISRLRQEQGWSMPMIGQLMKRHHTSVLHALQAMGVK